MKMLIEILLGALIAFYKVVLSTKEIDEMKEDLIENTTNLLLAGETYKIVFSFFRIENNEYEKDLVRKYWEYHGIKPEEFIINEFLWLNRSSSLANIYQDIIDK